MGLDISCLNVDSIALTASNFSSHLRSSPYDWKCVLLGANTNAERGFFIGLGRSKIYFLKSGGGGQWERTDDKIKFDLPNQSLIYAEIVEVRNMFALLLTF